MLSLLEEPPGLTFKCLFNAYVHIMRFLHHIICFRFTASEVIAAHMFSQYS